MRESPLFPDTLRGGRVLPRRSRVLGSGGWPDSVQFNSHSPGRVSGLAIVWRLIRPRPGKPWWIFTVESDWPWPERHCHPVRPRRLEGQGQVLSWYDNAKWQPETLAQFLVVELGVPGPPPSRKILSWLVGSGVGITWRRRGSPEDWSLNLAVITGLAVLIALACVAIGLLVWLVAT